MLSVSGHARFPINKVIHQSGMHVIIPVEYLGFVGGNVTQVFPDEYGRLVYKQWIISPLLSCGHITRTINEIAGTCHVCQRLVCDRCLLTCDLTGVPVCRKHSWIRDGVIVGNHAKKGFWRLKVLRIREEKMLGLYDNPQIPYK